MFLNCGSVNKEEESKCGLYLWIYCTTIWTTFWTTTCREASNVINYFSYQTIQALIRTSLNTSWISWHIFWSITTVGSITSYSDFVIHSNGEIKSIYICVPQSIIIRLDTLHTMPKTNCKLNTAPTQLFKRTNEMITLLRRMSLWGSILLSSPVFVLYILLSW